MFRYVKDLFKTFNGKKQKEEIEILKEEIEKYKTIVASYEEEDSTDEEFFTAPSIRDNFVYYELKVGKSIYPILDEVADFRLKMREFREEIADSFGLEIPFLKLTEDDTLSEREFHLFIREKEILKSYLIDKKILAVKMPYTTGHVTGEWADESLFGENAIWIPYKGDEEAEKANYLLVDEFDVIINQIKKFTYEHLYYFIDRSLVLSLFDQYDYNWASQSELDKLEIRPSVVENVLKQLLKENYPINDFSSILHTLIEYKTIESIGEIRVDDFTKYMRKKIKK